MAKTNKTNSDLPIEEIKQLSELLQSQDLTEIEIESGNWGRIKVRKETSGVIAAAPVPAIAAPSPTVSWPLWQWQVPP